MALGTGRTMWPSVFLFSFAALGALVYFGPRPEADTTVTFDPATIGDDPAAYIAESEAAIPDLNPETMKEIVWADPDTKGKTDLAFVYVHGFSASKEEVRPLFDNVVGEMGANLFYTRLAGHGRDAAALGEASVKDWVNDLAEAVAIGQKIGERVIVAGNSTGAALVAWAATQAPFMDAVSGIILGSPNFAVVADRNGLLTWPWAEHFVPLIVGPERSFEPSNEAHATYWITRYPTKALFPMAATAKLARTAPVESADMPVLLFFSRKDKIVDASVTAKVMRRWKGPVDTFEVNESDDPSDHVVAGRILSPSTTEAIGDKIVSWTTNLVRR